MALYKIYLLLLYHCLLCLGLYWSVCSVLLVFVLCCMLCCIEPTHRLVLEPTHRSGHIIDWITAREYDNLVSSVSVTDQLESEHKAVLAYFNPSKSLRNSRLVIRRKLKPIRKINLVLTLPNVSPSYHLLLIQHHITTQISAILDEHASATTRLLCQAKRERRQAKRRWRSTKLTVHRQIYQIEKQKV